MWSKVVGSKSDRTTADGKYLIIGNEGKEFIISDGSGIYKTGKQIITSKVTTTVGEAATTEIRNITLNDESPIEALEKLKEVKRSQKKSYIFEWRTNGRLPRRCQDTHRA